MDDLISIIVPIYNSEKYLSECLDSICAQTYKNLQIILVDDCSTDSSPKICKEYEKKDRRIEVYRPKKNGGQSASRNLGLKHAKGEWIAFADNDDTLEPEMLETLFNNAIKYNVEVSGCAHNIVINGKIDKTVQLVNYLDGVNNPDYYIINALYRPGDAWADVWSKLYRKTLKDKLLFPVGCQLEDYYVNLRLFYELESFAYTSKPLYNWRVYEGSQGHSGYFENKLTYFDVSEKIRNWFIEKNADQKFIDAAYTFEYCCKVHLLYDMALTKDKKNTKLAKSKINEVQKLKSKVKISNEFHLKSYLACQYRILRVRLA